MKTLSITLITMLVLLAASDTVFAYPPGGSGGGPRPSGPAPAQQPRYRWVRVYRNGGSNGNNGSNSGGDGALLILLGLGCLGSVLVAVAAGIGIPLLVYWQRRNRAARKERLARRHTEDDDVPDATPAPVGDWSARRQSVPPATSAPQTAESVPLKGAVELPPS